MEVSETGLFILKHNYRGILLNFNCINLYFHCKNYYRVLNLINGKNDKSLGNLVRNNVFMVFMYLFVLCTDPDFDALHMYMLF